MEHLFTSESIISFVILVILEVVLGIDNVIFVSIILNRLKKNNGSAKSEKDLDDHWHFFKGLDADGTGMVIEPKREICFYAFWKRLRSCKHSYVTGRAFFDL